jgi:Fucose 4-O-acetylase and related acetyltransferases
MENRNVVIDIAKGVGIIAVVWGHLGVNCPIKDEIYIFHMPLFFILSGFCFHIQANEGFCSFLKRKINAYIVPYFFFLLYVLFLYIALYALAGKIHKVYIYPSILIRPYGVVTALWFFLSLFFVQVIYFLINKYIKNILLKSVICLFSFFIGFFLYKFDLHIPLYIDSSITVLSFFYIGNSMKQLRFDNVSKTKLFSTIVLSTLIFGCGVYAGVNIDIKYNVIKCNPLIGLISAFSGSFLVIIFSYFINKVRLPNIIRILSFWGRNTILIFTLHMLCIEIINCLVIDLFKIHETYYIGILVVILSITLSIPIGRPIQYLLNKMLSYVSK